MTTASSLILIAVGAILAFAVSFTVAGISIVTVGAILMVVGGIGLAVSLATLAGYAPWGATRTGVVQSPAAATPAAPVAQTNAGPPANVSPPTV